MIFFKPMMNAAIKISGGTTEHLDAILPKADSSRTSQDAVAIAYVAAKAVEIKQNRYFEAVQYHPEFLSRPNRPHPLFIGLINAAKED